MSDEPKRESLTRFLARINPFDRTTTRVPMPEKPTMSSLPAKHADTSSTPGDPLLQRISGTNETFSVNRKRHPDVDQHMEALRREFAGRPLVCLELVRHIVQLRRQIEIEKNWAALKLLLEKYQDVLMEEMDTRWLLSICDTYADFGTELERSGAMIIVACVNLIKLADTERLMLCRDEVDAAKIAAQTKEPQPLYDGVTTYLFKTGDMPANMFARINNTLRSSPMLHRIWSTIFQRLQHSENLLSRIAKHHQRGEFFQKSSSK